jgi:phosphoribosylformimino-5-aminoimidazole carboxamide ribotide isomerase
MIKVIPSISIMNGKVVRTTQGDYKQIKAYDKDPIDLAMQFEDVGFQRLHFIDLDGAKKRTVVNYNLLKQITRYTKLKVDFTGGVTTDDGIRTIFECGASYVTIATVAVHEKEKFYSWYITYGGEKIILAADALNGVVLTKGWRKDPHINLIDHIDYYHEKGIRYVKSTEIARDGTLSGPNFDMYQDLRTRFPDLRIFACGGIRSTADIDKLDEMGVYGVIFGKSFYEGIIKLKEFERFLK